MYRENDARPTSFFSPEHRLVWRTDVKGYKQEVGRLQRRSSVRSKNSELTGRYRKEGRIDQTHRWTAGKRKGKRGCSQR